jgi:two-component system response regulator MprA
MRLVLISENQRIADPIAHNLRLNGFAVRVASLTELEAGRIDLAQCDTVVLDVALHSGQVLERCEGLSGRGPGVRLLVLMPSSMEYSEGCAELAPDATLLKPFDFEELLGRLREFARGRMESDARRVRYGDLELDLTTRDATRGGRGIALSAREFAILELLMRNPGRVFSRAVIGRQAWDTSRLPTRQVVDAYLSALRRKLDGRLIHSVKGEGYRFGRAPERDSRRLNDAAAAAVSRVARRAEPRAAGKGAA